MKIIRKLNIKYIYNPSKMSYSNFKNITQTCPVLKILIIVLWKDNNN